MAGRCLGQWLEEAGGTVSRAIEVQEEGPRGRALVATREIKDGELMIRIPDSAMISPQMGIASWRMTGCPMPAEQAELSDESWLAIYLALNCEQQHCSQYLYMCTLPNVERSCVDLPMMWELTDTATVKRAVQLLDMRGYDVDAAMPILMAEVSDLQKSLASEYELLRESVGQLPFSYEQYRYAYAMVNSRNFFISNPLWIDGGRAFLLPFVDILNHSGPIDKGGREGLRWYYNAKSCALDLVGIRTINAGDELFINYSRQYSGQHPLKQQPPFHFLVFYGFLEEEEEPQEKDPGHRSRL